MSPDTPSTKICPTCGTRLSESATRCLVCGSELTPAVETRGNKGIQASRMPELTLSLPAALGFLALFLTAGALVAFFALRTTGRVVEPTPAATATTTATVTPTPTETLTPTPAPTETPRPPQEYKVQPNDTCISIALFFNVSVQSIITLNNLPIECNTLREGQIIQVPYPTPTVTPQATNTLEPAEATRSACQKVTYTVQQNDTLSSIAANYNVPQDAIKAYNGLPTDTVYFGMPLIIPLCERAATPGPTPTPTLPPPYPAPNLLLPADGAPFNLASDAITLQWASIGTLRENEAYMVVVEDVTAGTGRRLSEYVVDTKFIVPSSFRPNDDSVHSYRWWVVTVRQIGTDDQGKPIWETAGAQSAARIFSWIGVAPQASPTP